MTSKERILSVINGQAPDHLPLTSWSFGFQPPKHLRWKTNGNEILYWYTKRLEHIHTLPQPWTLEDDFKRVLAWFSLSVDDILDVSVPWKMHPDVTYKDWIIPPGGEGGDSYYPVMARDYQTPEGNLQHRIKRTGDEGEGWPIQPDILPVFEDYNVPRGIHHLVNGPEDIKKARYLFLPPREVQKSWFTQRMNVVNQFAVKHGVFVQAWSAFGMDAVIWFTGVENAITMAMMEPESFNLLVESIAETDYARTELAVNTPGVDMVCQRGWYSSTDFWSPELFDQYVFPHLKKLTDLAHRNGKKFGYVMTTGIEILGPRLIEAGVDVLYFVDPLMDNLSLERIKELLGNRITLVGGISSLELNGNSVKIREEVRKAIEVLGTTDRFILHPVDSIFPDTPWEGVEAMIEAWKEFR